MNQRNTKQKELILKLLDDNRIHPTMLEIYELAKKEDQNIGQATIYRNINKLVEDESIIKLPSVGDEGYHYDINNHPHTHLVCNSCGKIIDIFDNDYEKFIKKIADNNSVIIKKSLLVLEGICNNCKK